MKGQLMKANQPQYETLKSYTVFLLENVTLPRANSKLWPGSRILAPFKSAATLRARHIGIFAPKKN